MKKIIQELKNDQISYKFAIQIDKQDIRSMMDKKLLTLSQKKHIHGFRQGKVPINILRKWYDHNVYHEVIQSIIRETSEEILQEKNIRPISEPNIEIQNTENIDGDLVYHLSVDQMPDFPTIEFSNCVIPFYQVNVSLEEIDRTLNKLAHDSAELIKKPKNYLTQKGDIVVIDFFGTIDNKPFEGGNNKKYRLKLGSGQFIEDFENQLIGVKESDHLSFSVQFPSDYHIQELAAQEAVFEVDVLEVFSQKEQIIDDIFAQSLGMKDLSELKRHIENHLLQLYEKDSYYLTKKALLDLFNTMCTYHVPEHLILSELEAIIQNIRHQNPDNKETDDSLKKEYFTIAKRRISLSLFLIHLAEMNNIQVSENDIQLALQEYVMQLPEDKRSDFLSFYKKNPNLLKQFYGPILEKKVIDFILSLVTREEKVISACELMQMIQQSSRT